MFGLKMCQIAGPTVAAVRSTKAAINQSLSLSFHSIVIPKERVPDSQLFLLTNC